MNNKEVAHLWAHEAKQSATGSSFYFEGATIYSYGPHFPIARHVTNKSGAKAILFTRDGYSNSTAKHKNLALSAIPPNVPVFFVSNPDKEVTIETLKEFEKFAVAAHEKSKTHRAGTFAQVNALEVADEEIKSAEKLAKFYGLKFKPSKDIAKLAKTFQKRIAAERERMRLESERKDAEAKKDAAEKIAAWIAGRGVTIPARVRPAYARIVNPNLRPELAELETSKGARVPLTLVKRALPRVLAKIEAGDGWHANGEKIDVHPYSITEIKPDGTVVAGCHEFEPNEVQRIAQIVKAYDFAKGFDQ